MESLDGPRTDVSDLTTFSYYPNGDLHTTTNAEGHITTVESYDPHGRPTRVVDPIGVATEYTYDLRGRLIEQRVAVGTGEQAVTTYDYDSAGNLRFITTPNGVVTEHRYDDANQWEQTIDGEGNKRSVVYRDAKGRIKLVRHRDSTGTITYEHTTSYRLNREGDLLRRVINGEGDKVEFDYDGEGNLIEIDVANGQQLTTLSYDPRDHLDVVIDPMLGIIDHDINGLGHLEQLSDPEALVTAYEVDGHGDVREQDSPDTGVITASFDANGALATRHDGMQHFSYIYDALGRFLETRSPSLIKRFAYDEDIFSQDNGVGRLAYAGDGQGGGSGHSRYWYDLRGNLIKVRTRINTTSGASEPWLFTEYRYDAADLLIGMTYPSGRTVDYTRDPLTGEISGVSTTAHGGSPQVVASNVDYLPFGPLKTLTYGNGLTLTRTLDKAHRVTGIDVPGVLSRTVGYDSVGNITSITDGLNAGNNQTLGYVTVQSPALELL